MQHSLIFHQLPSQLCSLRLGQQQIVQLRSQVEDLQKALQEQDSKAEDVRLRHRSEGQTYELQSHSENSDADFSLKKE